MALSIAKSADLDCIVELVNHAYRGVAAPDWTSEVGLIDGPRTHRQALDEMIASGSFILLAKDPLTGRLSGCVALTPLANAEWYLSMLAVSPHSQSAGLGHSIMDDAQAFARDAGARRLKISVINLREKLINWYERRGFARTGQTEPFPYHEPGVGTPLRQDLALITLTKSLAI